MKKAVPVALHVVAGIPLPLPHSTRTSGLRLPGGSTTTRWITRGASLAHGWGAALERALNPERDPASHCVLDLAQEGTDLEGLTDELHPLWDRGLPRIRAALDEARIQLAALGAQATGGILLLDPSHPPPADRLKKLATWCRKNDLDLLLRGETPAGWTGRSVPVDTSLADLARHFLSTDRPG